MIAQILSQLPQLLGASIPPTASGPTTNGDIFEAYVFALVLEAAKREQAGILYETVDGPFQGVATFRTSPGHIWSDARSYTHAVLQFSGKALLEAHIGIYMEGRSGVIHEADISVIPRVERLRCRQGKLFPKASRAVMTVECKFYDTPLGINLGRNFIGLQTDFGRDTAFFAMNQSEGSVGRLLDKHVKHWDHSVVPPYVNDVNRFIGQVQTVFKSYKVSR